MSKSEKYKCVGVVRTANGKLTYHAIPVPRKEFNNPLSRLKIALRKEKSA